MSSQKSIEACFYKSSATIAQCPETTLPEFAFIGRSNVGKSSLINTMCNNKNMAKTSSTPGKTQLINHYMIDDKWFLVDLPGYGYAKTSQSNRSEWEKRMRQYFIKRENMICAFVLIDARIKPQKIDLEFIHWLGENAVPFVIVFTKTDKLKPLKLSRSVQEYKKTLSLTWEKIPDVFISSSISKKGLNEILDFIYQYNNSRIG